MAAIDRTEDSGSLTAGQGSQLVYLRKGKGALQINSASSDLIGVLKATMVEATTPVEGVNGTRYTEDGFITIDTGVRCWIEFSVSVGSANYILHAAPR